MPISALQKTHTLGPLLHRLAHTSGALAVRDDELGAAAQDLLAALRADPALVRQLQSDPRVVANLAAGVTLVTVFAVLEHVLHGRQFAVFARPGSAHVVATSAGSFDCHGVPCHVTWPSGASITGFRAPPLPGSTSQSACCGPVSPPSRLADVERLATARCQQLGVPFSAALFYLLPSSGEPYLTLPGP